MPSYEVALTSSAERELDKLPLPVLDRIVPQLERLAVNPRPNQCKKLQGGESEWRIRIGDYRVIYTINDQQRLVEITRIRHRSEAYGR